MRRPLRIAFLHPDLGIGGAERLVVDGARELQRRGHRVTIFTAHHDPARCFTETRDGTLAVHVHGDFLPVAVAGRLRAPSAILRMCYLTAAARRGRESYDVFVCDLVPHAIPLLRLRNTAPVVFFCHFPDLLLTPRRRFLYGLYRRPIDRLEEATTGMADRVLVNSRFTASVFHRTFPRLAGIEPEVIYPGVAVAPPAADRSAGAGEHELHLLCLGRYERAKNVRLAIEAFERLGRFLPRVAFARLRLIVAGGYDDRLPENRATFEELAALAERLQLSAQVTFRRSVPEPERRLLLVRAFCVLHTAEHEHFGYVPLEAMAVGRPVVAAAGGGVLETLRHGETGLLVAPTPDAFAEALATLVQAPERAEQMGRSGRAHVAQHFSLEAFGRRLEQALLSVVANDRRTE